MTDTHVITAPAIAEPKTGPVLPAWRQALLFGTGFGIRIGARNLDAVLERTRPSGARLLAETTIADFRSRPAAEWGAELLRFLARAGESRLAATVVLPRDEVIVRTLNFPGVADRDVPAAIGLQIETLHPWGGSGGGPGNSQSGEEEPAWGWFRAGADTVMVGLARKTVIESYETLFSEAGIPLAALTFAPVVMHSALRIWRAAPGSILCFLPATSVSGQPRTEIYGESEARSIYSAEFSGDRERALAVARAELRLPPDYPAQTFAQALPAPVNVLPAPVNALPAAVGGTAPVSPLAWAAAVVGSLPLNAMGRAGKFANLLPPERRAAHNRMQYVFPILLASLLLAALIAAFVVLPAVAEKRYRDELNLAVRTVEPAALRAQSLEKRIAAERARVASLDEIRRRPQADLDVLAELTRLLPAPVWTSAVDIFPDSVVIAGEADQAGPLLKILDASPLFQNSEFATSVTRNKDTDQFRIRTTRRGRAGRTTP